MNRSHSKPHLSDDELIGLLYGLGDAEGHLGGCSECSERWAAMRRALGITRAAAASTPQITARMLATQRQQIVDRLDPSSGSHAWKWVPAAAAATLLAAGLVIYRPAGVPSSAPAAPVAVNAEADQELFTDVYSMERDVEPRAAAPIRSLFQETSFQPAQESKNQ